jgi:hypothetical protein
MVPDSPEGLGAPIIPTSGGKQIQWGQTYKMTNIIEWPLAEMGWG